MTIDATWYEGLRPIDALAAEVAVRLGLYRWVAARYVFDGPGCWYRTIEPIPPTSVGGQRDVAAKDRALKIDWFVITLDWRLARLIVGKMQARGWTLESLGRERIEPVWRAQFERWERRALAGDAEIFCHARPFRCAPTAPEAIALAALAALQSEEVEP